MDPDGRLRARLHSPPEGGAANDELVAMLARTFDLPRGAVAVVGGAQSRTKRVTLAGIDERRAAAVLAGLSNRAV